MNAPDLLSNVPPHDEDDCDRLHSDCDLCDGTGWGTLYRQGGVPVLFLGDCCDHDMAVLR